MSKILAFVESRDNKIKNAGFELASTAVRFAKELGCEAEILMIGSAVSQVAGELGTYGVKKVLVKEDPRLEKYSTTAFAKIIAQTVKQRGADIILITATQMGKDLAT